MLHDGDNDKVILNNVSDTETNYRAMNDEGRDRMSSISSKARREVSGAFEHRNPNTFSEEDWERIHLLDDYDTNLNGSLNPDYVQLKSKMQSELGIHVKVVPTQEGLSAETIDARFRFIPVPPDVVQRRVETVLENEEECRKRTRENIYCLKDSICEDIITKHGDEILCKIRCVAILQAPQTFQDHHGDCRLYLTKSVRDGISFHRIFFYVYGESAKYEAEENTEVIHKQWIELFENMTFLNVRQEYGFQSHWTHLSRRDVTSEFLTIPMDEVLTIHHRVCDYLEMRQFTKNEDKKEKEHRVGHCKDCPSCHELCSCSCKWFECCPTSFLNMKFWKWRMQEELVSDLPTLLCKYKKTVSTKPNVPVYDPYKEKTMLMTSNIETETSFRRYHTINITCMDNFEIGRKYRTVIVLHPDEPTITAMDFVCQANHLIDVVQDRKFRMIQQLDPNAVRTNQPGVLGFGGGSVTPEITYRTWIERMYLLSRNPYYDNTHLNPRLLRFYQDLFAGGLYVEVEISRVYYYNLIVVTILSIIGMIVSFNAAAAAASSSKGIYAVTGLFSLFHGGNRVYNLQFSEYKNSTLYKDATVVLSSFILAGVVGNSGGDPSTVLALVFQGLLSMFGAGYQIYKFLDEHGALASNTAAAASSSMGSSWLSSLGPFAEWFHRY